MALSVEKKTAGIKTQGGSTYPLKSSRQAWEEFTRSREYLVQLLPRGHDPNLEYTPLPVKEFRAREAFLAYFNPPTLQKYLQPIWVFKGYAILKGLQQAEWQAYVPAVAAEWIE